MESLGRYLPGTLYRFGSIYGSTDTLAFRVAARALDESLGAGDDNNKAGGRR